ncbi:MAG: TonB-dependent receptor [Schleiferiaceae bacterium]|nr:TonB-dependent receptor [Schleiferiaceae bacterium]
MKHLYSILFFAISLLAVAQSNFQSFKIVDNKGEPVPGAVLLVEGFAQAFEADVNGFIATVPLTALTAGKTIVVQAAGFDRYSLNISSQLPNPFRIILKAKVPENLQTIVVSAGKFEQRVEETTVSLDVIQPYLVQSKNPLDIQGTFDQSPGINVTDGQANIRGGSGWSYGTGSRVLVMVDDMPMISADANQVQWTLIPFEVLRQMEVIKGASSALYGTSALNGIVNIRTIDATENPSGNVTVFQGVYDSPSQFAIGESPRGVTGTTFNYTETKKGVAMVLSGNLLNDNGFGFEQFERRGRLHAKLDYNSKKIAGLSYGLTANAMNRASSNTLLWQSFDQPYVPLDSAATLTTGWDYYIDPRIAFRKGNGKHTYKGRYLAVNNNARSPTQNFENYSQLYYNEYQYQHFFKNGPVLTGGGVASFGQSDGVLFGGEYATTNYAAYAQADYRYKWLSSSLGVRYEYFAIEDRTFQRPVVRAGLNAQLAKATFLRASYGGGFRFPSIAEMYTYTNVGNIFIYQNPELEPEAGFSGEVGIKQGFQLGRHWKGFFDAAAYIMEYENMMEFSFAQWQAPNPAMNDLGIGFKSVNVGPTRITGLETTLSGMGTIRDVVVRFIGGYNYSLPVALDPDNAYANNFTGAPITYTNSSSNAENNILKYRYQHLVKADLQLDYKRFFVGYSVRYNSFMQNIDEIFEGQLIAFLLPGVGIRESRESTPNGDLVMDARAGYKYNDKLQFSVIANNITNRIYFPRPAMIGPPRLFMIQLQYQWR